MQREREAVLADVKKEGLKNQAALDTAAHKVGRRAQSRSLFSPSGDFMVVLDEGAPFSEYDFRQNHERHTSNQQEHRRGSEKYG
jgi:hypothetical protein